jgi:AraC-like DNA-binding protein
MTEDHSHHMHSNGTLESYKRMLDLAHEYIVQNYYEDNISIKDFCIKNNVAPRSVQRALSWFSTSWREMVSLVRMRAAAERLTVTDEKVSVVARRVGYRQPSQFAKAFQRYSGQTPTKYREQQNALTQRT